MLGGHLRASMAAIEARTGKILIEREFSWTLTAWRDDRRQPLPVSPVSAVSRVVMTDQNGVETVINPDLWYLEPDMQRPSLQPIGTCLPHVPQGASVTIGLLAGFGPEWDDLPADLAQAVLLLAAHFYEYRFDVSRAAPALPVGVLALIERYRTVRMFMGGRV
jgi:uncharacterized phiE125 gp8 family phage protein